MREKVVWQLLQRYAATVGVFGARSPRSPSHMCEAAPRGGELEQIQFLLGHQSVQTTERYLGTKLDLMHASNDGIKLRVGV